MMPFEILDDSFVIVVVFLLYSMFSTVANSRKRRRNGKK